MGILSFSRSNRGISIHEPLWRESNEHVVSDTLLRYSMAYLISNSELNPNVLPTHNRNRSSGS